MPSVTAVIVQWQHSKQNRSFFGLMLFTIQGFEESFVFCSNCQKLGLHVLKNVDDFSFVCLSHAVTSCSFSGRVVLQLQHNSTARRYVYFGLGM